MRIVNSCCKRSVKIALHFTDLSSGLDRNLELIADFCSSAQNVEHLNEETLSSLGDCLRDYLRKRTILEYFFFNRCHEVIAISDSQFKSELLRLKIENRCVFQKPARQVKKRRKKNGKR